MNLGKLAKQSSLYLLANIASRAAGFFMIPVYAHYLTPAQYGTVELIELCIQVIVIAVGIQALGGSMIRIFYDYGDDRSRSALVSSTMFSTASVGAIVAIIAFLFAAPVSSLLFKSDEKTWLIRMAFVAMAFGNMAEVALLYFRLRDRVGFVVAYSLIQLTASLGLNIFFIVFRGMGVWGFMWSKLITTVIGGTVLAVMSFRQVGLRWRIEPTRRVAAFALPLAMTGLSVFVIHFADRFFINQMRGLPDVGVYSLAYKFAFLISFLVGEPFSRVWNVTLYAHAGEATWRGQAAKAARYLTFFLFLVGLGLCAFISPLLSVMADSAYQGAVVVIPVVVLAYIAREIGDFFKTILYINKRAYLVSHITLLCACVNCLLNFIFIRRWGIMGAAWSTLITWALYMACCWILAQQEHKITFGLRSFAQVSGFALVIYGITQIRMWESTFWWLAWDAALIGAFCSCLVAAGYVPREEWQSILGYARARLKAS